MKHLITLFCIIFYITNIKASKHGRRLHGDLHHKHHRFSTRGQLNITIIGTGYFQFRLRVKPTHEDDMSKDDSQKPHNNYGGAYSQLRIHDISILKDGEISQGFGAVIGDNGFNIIPKIGDTIEIIDAEGLQCPDDIKGKHLVTNNEKPAKNHLSLDFTPSETSIEALKAFVNLNYPKTLCMIHRVTTHIHLQAPRSNTQTHASLPDPMGVEAEEEGDFEHFSQTVYSKLGSLHVNKYGYLCDDNGLLLISSGRGKGNARFHVHIPSRAENILVTPTGKIMVVENGGSTFTKVGHLKIVRFENPFGLNIRLRMKSNCNAANEDGFALGNWCAGTELDGKEHIYLAETDVSGPGIIGTPGSQGFGNVEIK
jgi:hypothetical protein